MSILTPAPTLPDRSDPATFADRADAFVAWWAQLVDDINAGDWYGAANILGTVSQSGGTPTGAILERGSNANGRYLRMADGTQLCAHSETISLAISNALVGGFRSNATVWTYPVTSVSTPVVSVTPLDLTALSGLTTNIPGSVSVNWAVGAVTSQGAADRSVSLMNNSRWF